MEQLGGLAVLGGVITGLMLWSWALGRWQGGFAAAPTGVPSANLVLREPHSPIGAGPDAVRQCQQAARHDRHVLIESGAWLGQIHADVSAYRRAAQVFLHLEAEEMALGWSTVGGESTLCRDLGNSGKPIYPMAILVSAPCACRACTVGTPDIAIRLDQPSAEAWDFARV